MIVVVLGLALGRGFTYIVALSLGRCTGRSPKRLYLLFLRRIKSSISDLATVSGGFPGRQIDKSSPHLEKYFNAYPTTFCIDCCDLISVEASYPEYEYLDSRVESP